VSLSPRPVVLVVGVLAIVGAIAAAAGLAYLFFRPAAPPAVVIATVGPGSSASPSTGTAAGGDPSDGGTGGLDGAWSVDTIIGLFSDFSGSWVGYRVDETFADNRANTAVGRTPVVEGGLTLAGSTVTAVDVTADLTRLESDDARRDGQLVRQSIQTGQFPTATFHLTSPIELDAVPADGDVITATATGELTLHGVARTITMPIQASVNGDVVTVEGSVEIQFADYDIERPVSFILLSVEDHGTIELHLHFRRR